MCKNWKYLESQNFFSWSRMWSNFSINIENFILYFCDKCDVRVLFHLQALEFRLRKLEELSEQTASTLSVIHRFMTVHSRTGGPSNFAAGGGGGTGEEVQCPNGASVVVDRPRRASEHSDVLSDISEVNSNNICKIF